MRVRSVDLGYGLALVSLRDGVSASLGLVQYISVQARRVYAVCGFSSYVLGAGVDLMIDPYVRVLRNMVCINLGSPLNAYPP